MTIHARELVSLLPIKAFSARVRDDLQAGASSVNLSDISSNYYHLGLEVSKMYSV